MHASNQLLSLRRIGEADMARAFGCTMPGYDALNNGMKRKLNKERDRHCLEMQQRAVHPVTKARLKHQGLDDCEALGPTIKVGGGYPERRVMAATTAETRTVHGLYLLPDGSYTSKQAAIVALGQGADGKPRGALLTCTDNLPVNLSELERDLAGTKCTLDLSHGMRRVINTMDLSAKPCAADACAELASFFLYYDRGSIAVIEAKLTTSGGIRKGGIVMMKPAGADSEREMRTWPLGLRVLRSPL